MPKKEYEIVARVVVHDDETVGEVLNALEKYGPCTYATVLAEVEVAA